MKNEPMQEIGQVYFIHGNHTENITNSKILQFLEKSLKSQFLLGTLLPTLTLGVIYFSKNCDFSIFLQFLEKSQFLLSTLLPPLLFDLINFSKNCDLSNFLQVLAKSQKLQKSQFLLSILPNLSLDLINFSQNCDFSNFSQFLLRVQTWTYIAVQGCCLTTLLISRRGSIPVSPFYGNRSGFTEIRFFIIKIFLVKNFKLSKLKSGK